MAASVLEQPVTLASLEGGEAIVRSNPKVSIGTGSPYQEPGWTDFADNVVIVDSVEYEPIDPLRSTLLTLSTYANAGASFFSWRDAGDLYLASDPNRLADLAAGLVSNPADSDVVYSSSALLRSVRDLSEALLFESLRSDQGGRYSLSVPVLTCLSAETGHDAPATVWSMVAAPPVEGLEGAGSLEGDCASVARGLLTSQECELREEIRSYADFSDDWDGDGATAPCQQAVEDALAFLESRPLGVPLPLPEVATIGDVGIYWDRGGVFVEVQFGGDGAFSYYAELKQGRTIVEEYGRDRLPLEGAWPEDIVRLLRQRDRS